MAEEKAGGGGSGSRAGGRKPRTRPKAVKAPTLDLKAEEISAADQNAASASKSAAKSSGSKAANPKDRTSAAETATAQAGTARQHQTEATGQSQSGAAPRTGQTDDGKRGNTAGRPAAGQTGAGMIGYAGAAITGAAAATVVSLGMGLVNGGDSEDAALQTRITEIEARTDGVSELASEIDRITARQTELSSRLHLASGAESGEVGTEALRASFDGALNEARSAVAALQAQVDTLAEQVENGASPDQTAALSARLDQLNDRVSQTEGLLAERANSEDITALRAALAEAAGSEENNLAGLASLGDQIAGRNAELAARIDALEGPVGRISANLAALEERMAESLGTGASITDIEGLGDRIAAMDGEIGSISNGLQGAQARVAATEGLLADIETRLSDLESGLAGLTDSIETVRGQEHSGGSANAAAIVALATLRDTVARGAPYGDALSTLSAVIGEDQPAITSLVTQAEAGVASATELRERFAVIAGDIVAASRRDEGESMFGRLVDSARGIVTIRPVGPVAGTTPAAIVSRIETHLKADETQRALAEWQSLPEAGRTASAAWGEALSHRAGAMAALESLSADILHDMSPSSASDVPPTVPATQ